MNRIRPVMFRWEGGVMVPLPQFSRLCARQFADGEEYPLIIVEERSMASHKQYFAAVHDGWMNLPKDTADHFPTSEHLRKWALVQTGYCTHTDYPVDNKKAALALAAMIRKRDEYCVIRVSGNVVQEFIPFSQSVPAMKKQVFEDSKRDVLDLIASMSRTTSAQLNREARHHGR